MSKTSDVSVQAQPGNSQVTDEVKEVIYSRLEDLGVDDAREAVILHHYRGGDFVAIRNQGVSDIKAFNQAYWQIVGEYRINRSVNDDTLWVSRDWIREQCE